MIILLCSFLGYSMLAQKVIGLRSEFVPAFVFSSIACIIYFCGLLRILLAGSIVVMVVGLTIFGVFLVDGLKKKQGLRLSFSLFGFFWSVGCLFFFSLLLRSKLTHYDNFSHWAIVVKQMLSTNAFPTAESNLIDFKNYPLGISSFLYYVCRFSGNYQSIMIFAQGTLIFSCFYAMFGIISEKKRFLLYAFLGLGCASLSFFNITIRINNLLVDFLLPIYTLAIFSMAHQYRFDHRRAFIAVLPMAALLTIIKSTGIIFAAIGLIFLFYNVFIYRRDTSKWRILVLSLTTFFSAMLPYLGWTWHMKTAFSTVENKFDLQNMPMEKTIEQMREITSLFIHTSIDISTRPAMGILVFNLIAIGAVIFNAFVLKKKWKLWKVLIVLDIVLLLYYIGIWDLYIFSMPLDEALWLAGFERYASSIVVLFSGGLVLTATVDIENSFYYKIGQVPDEQAFRSVANKDNYQKGVLICMAIAITLLLSEYNGIASIIQRYETSLPYKIQMITGDRWYSNGKEDDNRYLFYASDRDAQVTNFYMQYVGRYLLYSPNVDGICLFYEDNMDNLLKGYDYLIVVESDANERYLLYKHYGITGEEGIYKVVRANGQIGLVFEEN
jgi:hypothetical protein